MKFNKVNNKLIEDLSYLDLVELRNNIYIFYSFILILKNIFEKTHKKLVLMKLVKININNKFLFLFEFKYMHRTHVWTETLHLL